MIDVKTDDNIESPQPKRLGRIGMAILLGGLSSFGPLTIDMYLPALPKLANDLNTSASLSQLSLTFCLVGLAFGQLFIGPLSDARGRRKPLITFLAIYAAASLLCAVSPSIWFFLLLRLIQGLAGSAGIVISRAAVRDLYSGPELIKFYSLLMLAFGAVPIFAPVAGGFLLEFTSWRGVFILLGIIGIVMLLATIYALPETLPDHRRTKGGIKNTLSTYRGLFSNRIFLGCMLSQGLVIAAMFGYISGSPFVLQNIFGLSPQTYSILFSINGIGIIIAGQITGRLADRVSGKKMLSFGLGSAVFGGLLLLVLIFSGAGLVAIEISLFIVVSCVGVVSSSSFSLAMESQGKTAGSASALLGVMPFFLGSCSAPLVGLAGSYNAVPMGIVIAVLELAALMSYYLFIHRSNELLNRTTGSIDQGI